MIVQITAGGRVHAVDINGSGGKFSVSVDGRHHEVDVKKIGDVLSLLVEPPEGGPHGGKDSEVPEGPGVSRPARSYEVTVGPAVDGTTTVHVDGVAVEVSVAPARRSRTAVTKGAGPPDGGPQRITAPMPGKIVKLLVKPGDVVEARQGVVVVEAMKMENELRAKARGTVSEVRVAEGSSVEAGAILVLLD